MRSVKSNPEHYPVKTPKRAKPVRRGRAYWHERDKQVWLVTRPAKGVFAGMRALPGDGWSARGDGTGFEADGWTDCGTVRHVFTHFSLELTVLRAPETAEPPGQGEWWPLADIAAAGLPTLFAKAVRLAMAPQSRTGQSRTGQSRTDD